MAADSDIAGHAEVLATTVEAALPGWVVAAVARVAGARAGGGPVDPAVLAAAEAAGRQAAVEIGGEVRTLLAQDVDEQRSNPLAVLRRAVAYPTAVLREAGVPPVARSDFDERAF